MKQFLLMLIMMFLFLVTMRSFGQRSVELGFSPVSMKNMYQQIAQTKQELNGMLGQLKQNAYLSEIGMQKLIGLIDLELSMVDLLIKHRTGYIVQKAVNTKNKALKRTIPSIVSVYDVVLDLATMHAELEQELQHYYERYKDRLSHALKSNDKQTFLYHMMNTLEYYYQTIERMQYDSRMIK